ncbi:MAG TPA: DUF6252 family protein [Bacteroidia bacterium]|nr:DUF6252 family protein [Bacteroidia bacterium]
MKLFKYIFPAVVPFFLILSGCQPAQNNPYVADESCSDGILNQGETEIDCGGPCQPCHSRMTALVDGNAWEAQGNLTSSTNNGSILILAGNGTTSLSMIYTGPFALGTFTLNSAIFVETLTQTNYLANTGTITFTNWDSHDHTVSGTFSFTATETSTPGGTQKVVTDGIFKYVPY